MFFIENEGQAVARTDYGASNRYGTISLASAASQAGLTREGLAHSAIADARMTAGGGG